MMLKREKGTSHATCHTGVKAEIHVTNGGVEGAEARGEAEGFSPVCIKGYTFTARDEIGLFCLLSLQ